MIADTEWAYAAGLLDGEGCIHIAYLGPKNHTFALRVTLGNTSEAVIDWLLVHFGGTAALCRSSSANRPIHVWKVQARQVPPFLEGCLPYLIIKRAEAVEALRYYAEWPDGFHGGRGRPVPSEELERRLAIRLELQRLKGPNGAHRIDVVIPFRPSTVPMLL